MSLNFWIKFSVILFMGVVALTPMNVKGATEDLGEPSWEEIPDTASPEDENFPDPYFIDSNGIRETLIFDVIGKGAEYIQFQVDCESFEYRAIRQGIFESETVVSFGEFYDAPYQTPQDEDEERILRYACSL